MLKIKMIVGLGNIGKEYQYTRHNVGLWFINKILKDKNQNFQSNLKLNCNLAKISINYNDVILIFPNLYMNNSGISIKKATDYYKIKPEELLVVHDDLDINIGEIRLKKGGGHGGHNGIRNINQQINSNNYLRLRIGIGHPGNKSKVAKYVLSTPNIIQKKNIDNAINDIMCFLDDIIEYKLESIMQKFHTNNI